MLAIGGYTQPLSFVKGRGTGVDLVALGADGTLKPLHHVDTKPNPSYLATDAQGRWLVAVSELYDQDSLVQVFALAHDAKTPPTLVCEASTRGLGGCHVRCLATRN